MCDCFFFHLSCGIVDVLTNPQAFELMTGDYLFEPHTGDAFSRDEGLFLIVCFLEKLSFTLDICGFHHEGGKPLLILFRPHCSHLGTPGTLATPAHSVWLVFEGDLQPQNWFAHTLIHTLTLTHSHSLTHSLTHASPKLCVTFPPHQILTAIIHTWSRRPTHSALLRLCLDYRVTIRATEAHPPSEAMGSLCRSQVCLVSQALFLLIDLLISSAKL